MGGAYALAACAVAAVLFRRRDVLA
jgi:hypothetical protein